MIRFQLWTRSLISVLMVEPVLKFVTDGPTYESVFSVRTEGHEAPRVAVSLQIYYKVLTPDQRYVPSTDELCFSQRSGNGISQSIIKILRHSRVTRLALGYMLPLVRVIVIVSVFFAAMGRNGALKNDRSIDWILTCHDISSTRCATWAQGH